MGGGGKGLMGLAALAGVAIATGGFGLAAEAGIAAGVEGAAAGAAEGLAAGGAMDMGIGLSEVAAGMGAEAAAASAAATEAAGGVLAGSAADVASELAANGVAQQASGAVEGVSQGAGQVSNTVSQAASAPSADAARMVDDMANASRATTGAPGAQSWAGANPKTGLIDSVSGWWKGLSPTEKLATGQIAGGLVQGAGSGALNYLAQGNKAEAERRLSLDIINAKTDAERQALQNKLDMIRNGSAGGVGVNLNGLASNTQTLRRSSGAPVWNNGIINSAMNT